VSSTVVRVARDTTIGRPVDEVFDRLTDLDGYSTWMPRTALFGRCRRIGDAVVAERTRYRDASKIGPWVGEVTEFDRPSHVAFRQTLRWLGIDVMQARPRYVLAAEDGATTVSHVAEAELFGLFRLAKPMTAFLARRERRLVLTALRKSLEADKGPP
jgi:uncharacterized protein YndB with AHSA1/START domain